MRILHVIPALTEQRGGPSTVVCALAKHQALAGHEVSIFTTDLGLRSGEKLTEIPRGVELEISKVYGTDRFAYAPAFRRALRAKLLTTDIAHIHTIFTHAVHVALEECAAKAVPTIIRPCGTLHSYSLNRSRLKKKYYLALHGKMVRRVCSSWNFTSETESRESWPFDASRRFVLPNGIEPDTFNLSDAEARAEVAKRFPQIGGAPYLLFLGRLHPKKRVDLLLEAFLASPANDHRLVIAGPDEGLWPVLQTRLYAAGAAASRIIRLGHVRGIDKVALLTAAKVFALPSEHENFGVAALEALAAGTPLILSPQVDFGAEAAAAGFAFQVPLEVGAWSEKLSEIMTASDLPALGARGSLWVREHFSWSRIALELSAHYAHLIKDRQQSSCAA